MCNPGNYILTLETGGPPLNIVYCRVYTNWSSVDPTGGCCNAAFRTRVSDNVTASDKSIDVIQLPTFLADPPRQIACCSVSGHVCLASDQAGLSFYRFRACRTNDAIPQPYIDFRPAAVAVQMPFAVRRLAMADNWVAAGNDDLVVVLRIVDRAALGESDEITLTATGLTEDVPVSVGWTTYSRSKAGYIVDRPLKRSSNGTGPFEEADGDIDMKRFKMAAVNDSGEEVAATISSNTKQQRRTTNGGSISSGIVDRSHRCISNGTAPYEDAEGDIDMERFDMSAGNDSWVGVADTIGSNTKQQHPNSASHDRLGNHYLNDDDGDNGHDSGNRVDELNVCIETKLWLSQRYLNDPFHSLSMRPTYVARSTAIGEAGVDQCPGASDEALLWAVGGNCLVGVKVLVATANDGYVHQFRSNGEC